MFLGVAGGCRCAKYLGHTAGYIRHRKVGRLCFQGNLKNLLELYLLWSLLYTRSLKREAVVHVKVCDLLGCGGTLYYFE